jgi:hypothetical protein
MCYIIMVIKLCRSFSLFYSSLMGAVDTFSASSLGEVASSFIIQYMILIKYILDLFNNQ